MKIHIKVTKVLLLYIVIRYSYDTNKLEPDLCTGPRLYLFWIVSAKKKKDFKLRALSNTPFQWKNSAKMWMKTKECQDVLAE